MRNPERIEPILECLREVWLKNPDLRFAQLVYNAVRMSNSHVRPAPELFYMEDDKFLTGLKELSQNKGLTVEEAEIKERAERIVREYIKTGDVDESISNVRDETST